MTTPVTQRAHTCTNTGTTLDGRPAPPCQACAELAVAAVPILLPPPPKGPQRIPPEWAEGDRIERRDLRILGFGGGVVVLYLLGVVLYAFLRSR